MKRRSILASFGAVLTGVTAGCPLLEESDGDFRLWFVRVLNGTTHETDISMRIRLDADAVFETTLDGLPGRDSTDRADDAIADGDGSNVRMLSSEWGDRPGRYDVEYRLSGPRSDDSWQAIDVGTVDVEHAALDVHVLPGRDGRGIGHQLIEFKSESEAAEAVEAFTAGSAERD